MKNISLKISLDFWSKRPSKVSFFFQCKKLECKTYHTNVIINISEL
jgi:hypothetical protein